MRPLNVISAAPKEEAGGVRVRSVCCISLSFPPSTVAGVHRVRHLAKFLPNHGWHPTVVCVNENDLGEALDWKLLGLVREDTDVRKIRAIPVGLVKPFGITDLGLRAYWALRRYLRMLLKTGHYDLVFITGWPFYPMLLGHDIKRNFKIPIVLDFQDPWVSAWGAGLPFLSKGGLSHWLAERLEPRALRHADFVTSVSDVQNVQMAERYPWFDAARMAAIPIGGDPEDFRVLHSSYGSEDEPDFPPNLIHLSYVGTFLPRAEPLVRVLLRAFRRLRQDNPTLAARVRLNFIGTGNQPYGATSRVSPIAESEGVADAVHEVPQRLPYLQALSALIRSQGLLLIGSDEPHYTASKIYPALMSGRPYLSLFHSASSAHSILSRAGGGQALAFANQEELDALEVALCDGLNDLALHPMSFGIAKPESYEPYQANKIAAEFATVFDNVIRARMTR